MRKFNRADSNRGGALLSVIIAMTVVGILGTLVLSMSYTNFKMKQVEKKSKDNFYSAEAVLDEICVGLQQEISKQYGRAYQTVMENYGYYLTSAEMTEDFNLEFVLNMVEALQSETVVVAEGSESEVLNQGEFKYDVAKIRNYVNMGNYPVGNIYINPVVDDDSETTTPASNNMETLTDGLILRNIVVTYENKGYVNTISTDIKITIPPIQFARIVAMPEIADYIMIAQNGMELQNGSKWNIKGKAFAGSGIKIPTGSVLNVEDDAATMLITEGDIHVSAGSTFNASSTTTLWAKSITATGAAGSSVGSNKVSVLGRTYIKDDTTMNGTGNTFTLGGQYYGYNNNDADAAGSSAIIINGANTTLDMSGLKTLVLAGTSFVGTKASADAIAADPTGNMAMNTANILMGDSVAVKGNQIAYLLPTECDGVTSNPMPYDDIKDVYADAAAWEQWKKDALDTPIPALGRNLASYGYISIQPIFNARTEEVYLYLSFTDSKAASQYFMDYYGSEGGDKIKLYLDRYVSSFEFNDDGMNRIVTQGNYLVTDEEDTTKATYAETAGDVSAFAQELANYQSTFEALCAKLVENKAALTSKELSRTVYQNLIDHKVDEEYIGMLDTFLSECSKANADTATYKFSDNMEYTVSTVDDSTVEVCTIWGTKADKEATDKEKKLRCIIVDNDDAGDDAYIVPAGGNGIIIATGDVRMPTTGGIVWTGVIICNGKLILDGDANGSTLRASSDVVSTVMGFVGSVMAKNTNEATKVQEPYISAGDYAVMNFFVGSSGFSVGESSDANGAKVDVRDCLSFENWKSE